MLSLKEKQKLFDVKKPIESNLYRGSLGSLQVKQGLSWGKAYPLSIGIGLLGGLCYHLFMSKPDEWILGTYLFGFAAGLITVMLWWSNPKLLLIAIVGLVLLGASGEREAFVFLGAAIVIITILETFKYKSKKNVPATPTNNGGKDKLQTS